MTDIVKQASQGFRTRSAAKRNQVLSELRKNIVEGRLVPGSQLPTRAVLEREFQVSSATLQRALDQLIETGFVYARGSLGTFVCEHPPFMSRYGMVFPYAYDGANWSRFWMSLKNEAERWSREHADKTVPLYYGNEHGGDGAQYERLVHHVEEHLVAGLIFAGPISQFNQTSVLEVPGLARVAIGPSQSAGIPTINMDPESLLEPAMDYFKSAGCRKVALIGHAGLLSNAAYQQKYAETVRQFGMKTDPRWMLGLDVGHPRCARNLVHLLMSVPEADRPDALFIGDDNLVEFSTAGVLDAAGSSGLVKIVAHCNFPWPTPSVLPVKRLGFDIRELLRRCIEVIDIQRGGGSPQGVSVMSPVFEDDLSLS